MPCEVRSPPNCFNWSLATSKHRHLPPQWKQCGFCRERLAHPECFQNLSLASSGELIISVDIRTEWQRVPFHAHDMWLRPSCASSKCTVGVGKACLYRCRTEHFLLPPCQVEDIDPRFLLLHMVHTHGSVSFTGKLLQGGLKVNSIWAVYD